MLQLSSLLANRSESTAPKTGIETGNTGSVFYFSLEGEQLLFLISSQCSKHTHHRSITESYASTLLPSRVLEKKTGIKTGNTGNVFYFSLE